MTHVNAEVVEFGRGGGSERVNIASADARGYVGTVR